MYTRNTAAVLVVVDNILFFRIGTRICGKHNGLSNIGMARMGKDVRADLGDMNAWWCCPDHEIGVRLVSLDAKGLVAEYARKGRCQHAVTFDKFAEITDHAEECSKVLYGG